MDYVNWGNFSIYYFPEHNHAFNAGQVKYTYRTVMLRSVSFKGRFPTIETIGRQMPATPPFAIEWLGPYSGANGERLTFP